MDMFAFCGRVIESVSELIFDETIGGESINDIHTVFPDIVTQTEVGFIGKGGAVGVANQGCNPKAQKWNISTRKLKWEPESWEILLALCWTDLEKSAAVYSLDTGIDIPYFDDTDYMNIVRISLLQAMEEFWWRIAWFGDKQAANIADGGVLTDGVDKAFFTIINGFWKQIIEQATTNVEQRPVTIEENKGASYKEQRLQTKNIQDYFSDLVYGAPLVLRRQDDGFILVTQSVYDAYKKSLQDSNALESSRDALINGLPVLYYNGIPVIAIPQWDMMIAEYEDTGAKLNNPHRMVYTSRSVLGLGVDNPNSFDTLRIWNSLDTREVKIEGMGRADAKLTNPELFTLGI